MDSLSCKIKFIFENLNLDPSFSPFNNDWQIILGINGDFYIQIGEKLLFKEANFCLVEFSLQLLKWFNEEKLNQDFIYTSIESDDIGIIWIRQFENKWRIGSIYQEYEEFELFTKDEVWSALQIFTKELIHRTPTQIRNIIIKVLPLI